MAKNSQASAKALKASGHNRKDSSERSASGSATTCPPREGEASAEASDEAEDGASDSRSEQGSETEEEEEGSGAHDDDQSAAPIPAAKKIKRLKSGEPVLTPIASLGP
jgi:hypothetical protein